MYCNHCGFYCCDNTRDDCPRCGTYYDDATDDVSDDDSGT